MLRTSRWVTGSFVRDFVLFALVFAWMSQLLGPFGTATGIPSLTPFLLFLGLCFVVDLAVGHWSARGLLKILLVAGFMQNIGYSMYSPLDLTWIKHWVIDLYYGALGFGTAPIELVAEATRTTLFFIVLWVLQATVRRTLRSRIAFFLLLVLGMSGLAVMDTFFVESAAVETVFFLLAGLLILAFMQLPAIERVARMPQRIKAWPVEWLIWTLVLSLSVVGVSSAAPKNEDPVWPDPVAFLENQFADGPGVQKIGYGTNDSQLGGPFELDDTVVFNVVTDGNGYYRGEAKPRYTGKGWVQGGNGSLISTPDYVTTYQQMEKTSLETKPVTQRFNFATQMAPVVFHQYRIEGLKETTFSQPNRILYSDVDTRLQLNNLNAGDSYTVVSQVPKWEEKALKAEQAPNRALPALSPYLQLPTTLPPRVRQLAADVTKGAQTYYDKVIALESYLRSTYVYDTENVGVPKENQDYVDQFLFETKRGYCDNFSSAMVVMARALDIPARWVKGFTQGDTDFSYEATKENEFRYIVRNRNAHSWVEVYFPEAGWVAFEPTATFQMQREFKEDEQETVVPLPALDSQKGQQEEEEEEETTSGGLSVNIDWETISYYALAALGVLLAYGFFNRRKLITNFYLKRAYQGEGDVVMNAMLRLLFILDKFGWRRQTHMTMREYADELAGRTDLRGREMIPLAKLFERVRYGKHDASTSDQHELRDLWSRIVRKAGRIKKRKSST